MDEHCNGTFRQRLVENALNAVGRQYGQSKARKRPTKPKYAQKCQRNSLILRASQHGVLGYQVEDNPSIVPSITYADDTDSGLHNKEKDARQDGHNERKYVCHICSLLESLRCNIPPKALTKVPLELVHTESEPQDDQVHEEESNWQRILEKAVCH